MALFKDRQDAALKLAQALHAWRGKRPLVLGVPRGGMVLAAVIARELGGELDAVLVRKLRAPRNPELAVGAVDEEGVVSIEPFAEAAGANQEYLHREIQRQLQVLHERGLRYRARAGAVDPVGRVVIVVDDGMATGASMAAALEAVRRRQPAELICAVPVAASSALARARAFADQICCPHEIIDFGGVGQYYENFDQVEDARVEALLQAAPGPAGPSQDG
ncbi:MAG: phosphoribosyltransferase [Burkholderiales bacterium]|nr:phosphoribosyltransferase [Burkholderiales bacterium]MDE2286904.1 phosphoribosyltransferase [Burkholderiales bacterium]MDE2609585.1 phosphoribosyltransferase [Burkholderiales bacterium]